MRGRVPKHLPAPEIEPHKGVMRHLKHFKGKDDKIPPVALESVGGWRTVGETEQRDTNGYDESSGFRMVMR